MKKKFFCLSKKILILILCTILVSGSVVQRYKITANATSIVIGGVTYTISEVLAWLGATVLGITGISYVASDDYSKLIEIGYEAAKAMDAELDNAQDWLFATMDKDGKAYFYANNYFDAIQSCDIDSIIETSFDLSNDFAIFATDTLWDIILELGSEIEAKIATGEENFVMDALSLNVPAFNGYQINDSGYYLFEGVYRTYSTVNTTKYNAGQLIEEKKIINFYGGSFQYSKPLVAYLSVDNGTYKIYKIAYFNNNSLADFNLSTELKQYDKNGLVNTSVPFGLNELVIGSWTDYSYDFSVNVPVFSSYEAALEACQSNDFSGAFNTSKVYQIADWSDSPQHGDVRDVITQNPTLVNDYVSGMSNAFGISADEQVVAGEYPDVIDTSIGATPFVKPDVITPAYVGELDVPWAPDLPIVDLPGIAVPDLPWSNVWTDAGVGDTDVPATDGSGTDEEPPSEEEIRGKDPSGIQMVFGTLFDLIMILLMLLMIFLSCLAFIVMIFRIPATTGFLPPEMVEGFEYLKRLEILGFGMSVYEFFMALIYIILIFTVIGILRKNIDKLKFPRKGKW